MAAYPARVLKGTRAPGQMGNKQVTVKNLEVVEVNEEENLLLLKGAVPGANGTYLEIVKSK
jgi:large subunit ribosomal protein L3